LVIIPIGVPGLGKTHLCQKLAQHYKELVSISSDEVRREQMDRIKKEDNSLLDEEVFSQTQ
jgi:adenylate kinase family enzyme